MTLNIRAHRSNLSRRLGPVFAEAALEAQEGIKTGQEAPQKASPIAAPQLGTSKAYKPAHGGYPGTPTLRNPQQDGNYLIVIPLACWHVAANDKSYFPPGRTA